MIMLKKKKATQKDRTPCEVYSRVVGYLRPVNQWNEGKNSEYRLRKEYKA
jgi:ribonucleoside-triphosphate reductase (formate)